MRPLILKMQAFGPYAGSEIIDFSELENRTMFVITGKTGSGKTTIFDGICFAIYGKASGEDRSGQDLRSQFADEHLLTEVSLQFTLRDKTYFIHRSPQQEKRKKSGEGTTTVPAKAELYELFGTSEKKLLGANVKEVNEKIKDIIGLDADQFRQILMIPQGEFRKLLTSESKDKEQILQKLFHTESYKRMEDKLKEDSLFLQKECKKNEQARMELLKGIIIYEDHELQSAIATDEPNEEFILPLLANEIAATIEKSEDYDRQIYEKKQSRDLLNQKITIAEQLIEQFLEKDKLQIEKHKLEEEQPNIEQMKELLKNAQKALTLEKQEKYYLRVGEQAEKVKQDLAQVVQQAEKVLDERKRLAEAYQIELEKSKNREEAQRQVHHLQQMKESVEAYLKVTTDVETNQQKWRVSQQKREAKEFLFTQKEKLLEQTLQEKVDAEKATLAFVNVEREVEKSKQLLQQMNKLSKGLQELAKVEQLNCRIEEQFKAQTELFEQERKKYILLEETWRTSQAGLLAATLEDGHACPVCGAFDHPSPAHLPQEIPSEMDMKKQKAKLTELENQKRELESEFFQIHSNFQTSKQILAEQEKELKVILPTLNLDELPNFQESIKEELFGLQKELSQLQQQKNNMSELDEKCSRLKTELLQLKSDFEQLKVEEEQAKIAYIEQNTKWIGLAAAIPEDIRTEQAYLTALKEAEARQELLQQAFEHSQRSLQKIKEEEAALQAKSESLKENFEALQQELDEERQKFASDMKGQGFATYKEYSAAKRSEQEMQGMDQLLQQYEKKWQTVISLYHNMELKLKDVDKPDIEGLKQTFHQFDLELERLRSHYNDLMNAKQKNEEIQMKLAEMKEQQQKMEEQHRVIGHLYEIASGKNPFRITFERYVLAAFLDDILKEANTRLLKMTSGRYQLLRKIDPTRKNIQSGLELSVYDQYTSQERHVKTLSGGESFKASLALALGLADVVQQHAGGISLETMFIDEGFGTLDPESLDQAIEALMDIQNSGRLVGIISHVPELKERIDAQLEVVATQNGSRTSFSLS